MGHMSHPFLHTLSDENAVPVGGQNMKRRVKTAVLCAAAALALVLGGCDTQEPISTGQVKEPIQSDSPSAPVQSILNPQGARQGGLVEACDYADPRWFDDALMIGHSMMVGFEAYGGLWTPHYCALTGASVDQMLSYREFPLPLGGNGTLEEVLQQESYGKVYVMLGVNEITSGLEATRESYEELLALIWSAQPEAQIYVISVLPVTRSRDSGGTITIERILAYNEMLLEMCEEDGCWYLDLYSYFADEEDFLPSEDSTDGLHPVDALYPMMLDYLDTHWVAPEES